MKLDVDAWGAESGGGEQPFHHAMEQAETLTGVRRAARGAASALAQCPLSSVVVPRVAHTPPRPPLALPSPPLQLLAALSVPAVVGGGSLAAGSRGIVAAPADAQTETQQSTFLALVERKLLEMFRKYSKVRPMEEKPDGSPDRLLIRVRDLPARDVAGARTSSRRHTLELVSELAGAQLLRCRQLRLLSKSCCFLRRRAALGRGEWCAHRLLFIVPTDSELQQVFRIGSVTELRPLVTGAASGGTPITSLVECLYISLDAAARADRALRTLAAGGAASAGATTAPRRIVEAVMRREKQQRISIAESTLLLLYSQLSHIAIARKAESLTHVGGALDPAAAQRAALALHDVSSAAVHLRGAELERQLHRCVAHFFLFARLVLLFAHLFFSFAAQRPRPSRRVRRRGAPQLHRAHRHAADDGEIPRRDYGEAARLVVAILRLHRRVVTQDEPIVAVGTD